MAEGPIGFETPVSMMRAIKSARVEHVPAFRGQGDGKMCFLQQILEFTDVYGIPNILNIRKNCSEYEACKSPSLPQLQVSAQTSQL